MTNEINALTGINEYYVMTYYTEQACDKHGRAWPNLSDLPFDHYTTVKKEGIMIQRDKAKEQLVVADDNTKTVIKYSDVVSIDVRKAIS